MTMVRIGTRASQLAQWQANWCAEQLKQAGIPVEIVLVTTAGDKIPEKTQPQTFMGQPVGLFTKEIQQALLEGTIDLAVHSLKDLPTESPEGLALVAVPARAAIEDVMVKSQRFTYPAQTLDELPDGTVIGTCSVRRQAQLRSLMAKLGRNWQIVGIRGNLNTRLRKCDAGDCDVLILARAGVERLGWQDRISALIPTETLMPAVAQGALGLETRSDDAETIAILRKHLHDETAYAQVLAERAMLKALDGGCTTPIGAVSTVNQDGLLTLRGRVISHDGTSVQQAEASGRDPVKLGQHVAQLLIQQKTQTEGGQMDASQTVVSQATGKRAAGRRVLMALESSCDGTAAAVIREDGVILSEVVASQAQLHAEYGGVVPELASRAHMERILPVIDQAVKKAGISLRDLDAVAIANAPGLAGSLLVGLMAAKTLAMALDIPLIAVNHLQAHVYACQVANQTNVFPCVGMIVSGGHTSLYRCQSPLDFELLGATIDDAAGEAFDKVAAMLQLPYPGGPNIQRIAEQGNPQAYDFPRAFIHDKEDIRFSFSGLKTAVRYQLVGTGRQDFSELQLDEQTKADIAASFQAAVVDVLAVKARHALRLTGLKTLCLGGGVAANGVLRKRLEDDAKRFGYRFYTAPLRLCTDNAVMGAIAWERFHAGEFAELDLDIEPN